MIRLLISLLRPFSVIARELSVIRELYELDLAARENPVYRRTQTASKSDVEVSYSDTEPEKTRKRSWLSREEEADLEPED